MGDDSDRTVFLATSPQVNRKPDNTEALDFERVPGVIYDERSTYRRDFTEIRAPYDTELPWKPNERRIIDRGVRGTLPGFYGPEYTNPYSRLKNGGEAKYESSGAERMRQDIANEVERQRAHDRAIPHATVTLPDQLTEKFTEYRDGYCKTAEGSDQSLPDVKPISDGLYKYYKTADSFSYNSQHKNKAY